MQKNRGGVWWGTEAYRIELGGREGKRGRNAEAIAREIRKERRRQKQILSHYRKGFGEGFFKDRKKERGKNPVSIIAGRGEEKNEKLGSQKRKEKG